MALCAPLLLLACDGDGNAPDAAPMVVDASELDGAGSDGALPDASAPDAAAPDAASPDASLADAFIPDAMPAFGGFRVVFPPPRSRTDSDMITVRGVAVPGMFSGVRVNGVTATSADGFATWQAQVPLSPGGNVLVFGVDEPGGMSTDNIAQVHVFRAERFAIMNPQAAVVDAAVGGHAHIFDRGLDALLRGDLNRGVYTTISDAATGGGPMFVDAWGMDIDVVGNRALISDHGLAAILAVDLSSGARSVISGPGVGAGPALQNPLGVALGLAGTLFVVDGGAIVRIDLVTGDRSVLGGSGPAFNQPADVVFDSVSNRLLVSNAGAGAVFSVDAATGDRTILSNSVNGAGPAIPYPGGLALDGPGNRVLVASQRRIVSVDLTTGDRTVTSGVYLETGTPLVGGGIS